MKFLQMTFLLKHNFMDMNITLKLARNAVHGSDSYEAAGREIDLLFPTITGKSSDQVLNNYWKVFWSSLNVSLQHFPLQAMQTGSTLATGSRTPSRRSEKSRRPILQGGFDNVSAAQEVLTKLHEKFSHQVCRANTPAGLDCDVSDEARWTSSMV